MSEQPDGDARERLKRCVHDLNNVLGQILGFGSLLVRDIGEASATGRIPPALADYSQELLAAGMRGESVVKELAAIVRALPAGAGGAAAPRTAEPAGRHLLIAGIATAEEDPRGAAFAAAGWQVEAFRSGAEALRRFRSAATPFDAVIAFPSAEEIPGADLVAAIKALKPSTVRLLVLGPGVADEDAARIAGADGGIAPGSSGLAAVALVESILHRRGSAG